MRRHWWLISALAMLVAGGALRSVWLMFRSPVPVGIDGYYYLVQARHLLSHHELYYPTPTPAVLYLLAGAHAVFRDPALSLKMCSLALGVALCAGVFGILRSVTGQIGYGALGALLVLLPTMHLFLLVEFVSNLGAVALMAAALWCIVRASESGRRIWWLGAAGTLAGALFSHRMGWGVAPA